MRILLLLDEIYLPSYGGGIKACRLLLEGLARRGHDCHVIAPALVSVAQAGPTDVPGFLATLRARGIGDPRGDGAVFHYRHAGVEVEALKAPPGAARRDWVGKRLMELRPDWILIPEDKRRDMMQAAMGAFPQRVVLLLQTLSNLPFGPLSRGADPQHAGLIRKAAGVAVISRFLQDYVRVHGGLEATLLRLPVYGPGPFPMLADRQAEFVTLINPCIEKGLPIFLELVRRFRDVAFAAVPTWGATATVAAALEAEANVTCLAPRDDIEDILRRSRVVLVPSLWPETFGYIVVEAMLRGIPVLASDIGGLPEAKLGVDYLLPVRPAEIGSAGYESPPQNIAPWAEALRRLLDDEGHYRHCAEQSKRAAEAFHAGIDSRDFENFLLTLDRSAVAGNSPRKTGDNG